MAQDLTTVKATDSDISDNLDLEAVASLFGESKNLEDFEKRLNNPETQISNLDLNEDGEVDYLRVLETSQGDTYVVAIQAVIGEDQFQDVATIDIEKDKKGKKTIQVVGDVHMYGSNYIIEPVYVKPPVIFSFFWGALYRPWSSPFYWGHYPHYYHPWKPFPVFTYRKHVHVHVNVHHRYHRVTVRKSHTAVVIHKNVRRNDYGKKYPERSFVKRNHGIVNRHQLTKTRVNVNVTKTTKVKATGKPVNKKWKKSTTTKNTKVAKETKTKTKTKVKDKEKSKKVTTKTTVEKTTKKKKEKNKK